MGHHDSPRKQAPRHNESKRRPNFAPRKAPVKQHEFLKEGHELFIVDQDNELVATKMKVKEIKYDGTFPAKIILELP